LNKKTLFVTFYSFKGGVGRTFALVNVAFKLAQEGKRIVIIDFDFEAPGVHKYPFCKRKINKGLLEYIYEYIDKKSFPEIKKYTICPKEKIYKNIILLPAGTCDSKYREYLAHLDWDIFFKEYYGSAFIEGMKSEIINTFKPDYVFVDSRTGLTDTGNICTLLLPDAVVLMFSLNQQNKDGIEMVYKSITKFKNPNYPEKKIAIIPVASPIPYGEAKLRNEMLNEFSKIFQEKKPILVLPYHPQLAFKEIIITEKEMEEEDIAERITRLKNIIKSLHPYDTTKFKQQVAICLQKGELEKATEYQKKIVEIEGNNANELNNLAVFMSLMGKSEEAIPYYDKAIELESDNPDSYNNKANALRNLKRFEEAIPYYDKAIELKPDNPSYYNNRADTLCNLKRFEEAIPYYDKAIELKPDNPGYYNNKANALCDLKRFEEAMPYYDKAIELESDNPDSYNNKAYALYELKRFEEAIPYYDKAIELKPDNPEFYNNKAIALYNLKRFEEAIPYYNKAIELKPDNPEFYSNKASSLCNLKRFEEAIFLCDKAIELDKNNAGAFFNKACALSQSRLYKDAIINLNKAIDLNKKYREMAKTDEDLKPLHNLSEFKKIFHIENTNKQ